MKATKKIVSNTLFQAVGKLATMATTVVVTMLVTRQFGAEGYGRLAIILTFPSLFYIVANFGMNAIVAGEIARRPGQTEKLFNSLLTIRLAFTLFLALSGAFIIQLFPYDQALKLFATLALSSVALFGVYTSTNAVYQAKLAYQRSMFAPLARSGVVLVATLVLLASVRRVEYLAFAYILGDLAMGGVALLLVRRFVSSIRLVYDKKLFLTIVRSAIPLGIATITNPIIGKADSLLLSVMRDSSAVGFYTLAYKVFEVCLVLPVFFVNSAYPYMIRHHQEGRLKGTTKRLALALFLAGLFLTGVVWLLAPLFVRVLGGEGFASSVLPLRLLAVSLPVFFVTNVLLWHLITVGKRKLIPAVYWLAVAFNTSANLLAIPRYSFAGSAVVNGLTELLVLFGLLLVLAV